MEGTKRLTLFLKALSKSCTLLPSYLRNLPKFSLKTLSSLACQSFPTIANAPVSSTTRLWSRGSRHMISNRSDASWRKFSRRAGSQKKGCTRQDVVSGLFKGRLGSEVRTEERRAQLACETPPDQASFQSGQQLLSPLPQTSPSHPSFLRF